MKKDDARDPPPLGAVRLGIECEHGYRPIEFVDDRGEVRRGHARKVSEGESAPPGDYEVARGQLPGQFEVGRRIGDERRATDGPVRVNSRAYRSNWDQTFGRYDGKAS
jgi:hypothetical protein